MSESMVASCMPSRTGDKILGWLNEGSHGVSHIFTESPHPILHCAPCLRTSLPWSILRHAYKPLGHSGASMKEHVGKNLLLNTLWKRDCIFCKRRQACLAKSASLKRAKFLKPIPPLAFGWQRESYFTQWILHLSPCCPHQNLRISLSISLHKPNGNLKQLIV